MVSEGHPEVLHMATRRKSVTCTMMDNGDFDETGDRLPPVVGGGRRTTTRLLRVLDDHLAAVHASGVLKDEVDR